MKRILGAAVFLIALAFGSAPAQSGEEKVTICHIPPGNPDNRHTITISISAWPAHESLHGDTMGACEDGDPG